MAETRVNIVDAEALRIGPNERLILSIPEEAISHDGLEALVEKLERMGLRDRVLVIVMDGVKLSVVDG